MTMLMDLANWPPAISGMWKSPYGVGSPTPKQVAIKEVVRVSGKHVDFKCTFESVDVDYPFDAPDEKTAEKVATILRNHKGMDLISVGNIEIPED